MNKTCTEACNQLKRWNSLQDEWDDNKSRYIEEQYIDPMQNVLTHISEKLHEINYFINDIEEKINTIKEGSGYG